MTSPFLQHRDSLISRPVFRPTTEKSALSAASIAAAAAPAAAAAAAQSDPGEGP